MRWIRFLPPVSTGTPTRWSAATTMERPDVCHGVLDDDDRVHAYRGVPWGANEPAGQVHRLDEVTLDVPVMPPTFYAAGLNYVKHIQEHAQATGTTIAVPPQADIGYRAVNALVAHESPIVLPPDAEEVEYEGELVVVIGQRARHLTEAQALDCVFGYTIGNDVSERRWQASDRTFWRAKNSDTFKPMGPWIDTGFDLDRAETTVRLNGQVRTRFRTADMLFDIRTFISRMTRYLTLQPGVVIWMGTDGKSPTLPAGDTVEVGISGLGLLRNPVVAS